MPATRSALVSVVVASGGIHSGIHGVTAVRDMVPNVKTSHHATCEIPIICPYDRQFWAWPTILHHPEALFPHLGSLTSHKWGMVNIYICMCSRLFAAKGTQHMWLQNFSNLLCRAMMCSEDDGCSMTQRHWRIVASIRSSVHLRWLEYAS